MTKSRFTPPASLDAYSGFIFDCDGTLVDTMPLHLQVWRQVLKEGGGHFHFSWETFVSRAGMSLEQTVVELSDQFNVHLDGDLIARRHPEVFSSLNDDIKPVHDVLEFAKKVAPHYPVAVASGNTRANVLASLKAIGALDLFEHIITPEDVTNGKPAPEMFLLAAQKMNIPPTRCLVLEDGALGFEAARRAHMDYLVVESPAPEGVGTKQK